MVSNKNITLYRVINVDANGTITVTPYSSSSAKYFSCKCYEDGEICLYPALITSSGNQVISADDLVRIDTFLFVSADSLELPSSGN